MAANFLPRFGGKTGHDEDVVSDARLLSGIEHGFDLRELRPFVDQLEDSRRAAFHAPHQAAAAGLVQLAQQRKIELLGGLGHGVVVEFQPPAREWRRPARKNGREKSSR